MTARDMSDAFQNAREMIKDAEGTPHAAGHSANAPRPPESPGGNGAPLRRIREIELLAPARDAETGIEAIRHGADAVYIGAPAFGARAAAANSVGDIRRLAAYAHVFNAKVYVTLNTILYDSELGQAERLARELYDAGADALIVQDAAFLSMPLPPIPLHASTQADNRTPEKVRRLYDEGFDTAVLARELSLEEIRRIHESCPGMRLEAFVHGALCVSLSGRCYASQYCFGRSANRGECAQFCRMPFDLEDGRGGKLLRQKHLLSLRDMNRSRFLEEMMDAGVSSFKIEGRLKSAAYVKNITAFYRRRIDSVFSRRGGYARQSAGACETSFEPSPEKSFNRGFTDFFLFGRRRGEASLDTPKSTGEPVGRAEDVRRGSLAAAGRAVFSNGDGLCFFDGGGRLRGFRVNKVSGGRLFPQSMPEGLREGARLFRNFDAAFARLLSRPSATRLLGLDIEMSETGNGYSLLLSDETGRTTEYAFECPHTAAVTPQGASLRRQLSRLGGSLFRARSVTLRLQGERFIPASVMAAARRGAVAAHTRTAEAARREEPRRPRPAGFAGGADDGVCNVSNSLARAFYLAGGAARPVPAFELEPRPDAPLMTCRYCIRYELGACLRQEEGRRALPGSLFLRLSGGLRFRLDFDCGECVMRVYADRRGEPCANAAARHGRGFAEPR